MEKCTKYEALKKSAELCGEVKIESSLQDRFRQMRSSLFTSKKALQYLQDRNINCKLEIGYDSYQSGYKQLQNCITFPLKDKTGKITSLYGRSISNLKSSNHYYLKKRKDLYPRYLNQETKTLIITEDIIDTSTVKAMKPNIKISKVEIHESEDIKSVVLSHEPEILTQRIGNHTFYFSVRLAA